MPQSPFEWLAYFVLAVALGCLFAGWPMIPLTL